jgi:putative Holliday junction resolvase
LEKRILGIDLGKKRVGLAITDPLNIISQPFKTLEYKSKKKLYEDLKEIITEKNIGTLVFGLPTTLSGTDSKKTTETRKLIEFIKSQLPNDILIVLEDEALTTVDAHEILHQMGKKPSKNRDIVDQIAAQCILTAFQNRQRN